MRPAERRWMSREHHVPLLPDELALLEPLPRFEGTGLAVPRRGDQVSDTPLGAAMKRRL